LKHPENTIAFLYLSGNGAQNDRIWLEEYHKNLAEFGEKIPESPFLFNREVNRRCNQSWRKFIQHPKLWLDISQMDVPSLFLYGSKDIRPSWPAEQISNLLPNSKFVMIQGAGHYTWLSHYEETKNELRKFVLSLGSKDEGRRTGNG
jgi:proline iminopeptidase